MIISIFPDFTVPYCAVRKNWHVDGSNFYFFGGQECAGLVWNFFPDNFYFLTAPVHIPIFADITVVLSPKKTLVEAIMNSNNIQNEKLP